MKPKEQMDLNVDKTAQPRFIIGGNQDQIPSVQYVASKNIVPSMQQTISNVTHAGLWQRMASSVIDEVILLSLQWIPCLGFIFFCYFVHHCFPGKAQELLPCVDSPDFLQRLLCISIPLMLCTSCIIPWLYVALFEASPAQATPGKRLLNLKVTSIHGNRLSFVRASLKLVIQSVLLAAFVMIPAGVICLVCLLRGFALSFDQACAILSIPVFILCFGLMLFTEGRQTLFDKLCGRLVLIDKPASPVARESSAKFGAAAVVGAIAGCSLMAFLNINPREIAILPSKSSGWVKNMSGNIVTASTEIREGQYIQPNDIKPGNINHYRTPLYAISSKTDACGHLARRNISAGEIISYGDLWPRSFEIKGILSDRPVDLHEPWYYKKLLRDCNAFIANNHYGLEEGYSARAWVYNQYSEHQKAVEDCDHAIKMNPAYPNAYLNRANAYKGLQKYQRALDDCNKCISLDSDWQDAYLLRASIYDKLGKGKLALMDRRKVKEISKP